MVIGNFKGFLESILKEALKIESTWNKPEFNIKINPFEV